MPQANKIPSPIWPPENPPHLDNESAHRGAHVILLCRRSFSQCDGKKRSHFDSPGAPTLFRARRLRKLSRFADGAQSSLSIEKMMQQCRLLKMCRPVFKCGPRPLAEKDTGAANMFICACEFLMLRLHDVVQSEWRLRGLVDCRG